jgi:hypothetical protein
MGYADCKALAEQGEEGGVEANRGDSQTGRSAVVSPFLKALREKDPSSLIAYHLEGLLEAMERARFHMGQVDEAVNLDPEELAGRLIDLQIEIFDHMGYHMKQLRRPLQRLIDAAYKNLPDISEDEALESLHQLLAHKRSELEGKRVEPKAKTPAAKRKRGVPQRGATRSVK